MSGSWNLLKSWINLKTVSERGKSMWFWVSVSLSENRLTEIRISVFRRGANRLDDPIHPAVVFHWKMYKTKGTEERNELQLDHNIWYHFLFIQWKILVIKMIPENKLIKCFFNRHSGHNFYWQFFFRKYCTVSLQCLILKILN